MPDGTGIVRAADLAASLNARGRQAAQGRFLSDSGVACPSASQRTAVDLELKAKLVVTASGKTVASSTITFKAKKKS